MRLSLSFSVVAGLAIAGKTTQVDLSKNCNTNPPGNCYDATPRTFYIEGGSCSSMMRDITITMTWQIDGVQCSDYVNVTVVGFVFVNPVGNPLSSPPEPSSEYTFTSEWPGELSLMCLLEVCPFDPDLMDSLAGKITFSIDSIGNSSLEWDPPGGVADSFGVFYYAGAIFTGLPQSYSDFGLKHVRATINDARFPSCHELTQNIEVFFAKNATNHPLGEFGLNVDHVTGATLFPPIDSPNWFYYWKQAIAPSDDNVVYVGSGCPDSRGAVPWMYLWPDYHSLSEASASKIWIASGASTSAPGRSSTTGIDLFANIILHERKHVDQIAAADALIASPPWSWKVAFGHPLWNHDVFDNNHNDIPDSWLWDTYPNNDGLEAEARTAETNPEHHYLHQDWGDPGKQHKHTQKYDD